MNCFRLDYNMKNLLIILLLPTFVFAQHQEKVEGDISTKDTAKLSLLGVYQDEFPNVSVVFRAEKNDGEPVFGLGVEDMLVSENGKQCEVISVQELSKEKPINIGVVLDHSGSMLIDGQQLIELGADPMFIALDQEGYPIFPEDYTSPIDMAKEALNNFVSTFKFDKDKISVVGFSSEVDTAIDLSDNEQEITAVIDSMKAHKLTAFYDALIASIEKVRDADGLSVVVALTDGNDNMSKNSYEDVVDLANASEIPIYLVGLGDVNTDSLTMLAEATDGQFFYANSATSLTQIYDQISTKLQAFYDLVYRSPNLEIKKDERILEISFNRPNIHLISEDEKFEIEKNVITYIEEKEAERKREYFIYGGIGVFVLIAGGLLFYFAKRKKKKKSTLKFTRVYPNPTAGKITVEVNGNESPKGELIIMDQRGNLIRTAAITSSSVLDISDLQNGMYLLTAKFEGQNSDTRKVVLRK